MESRDELWLDHVSLIYFKFFEDIFNLCLPSVFAISLFNRSVCEGLGGGFGGGEGVSPLDMLIALAVSSTICHAQAAHASLEH